MHRRFLRRNLAAWRGFPAEVKEVLDSVLLGYQDALESLAANPTRSAAVVPAIYGKKLPSADLAYQLCSAPLRAEEYSLVVPREKRVTVLNEFFRRNHVDLPTLSAIAAKASPAVARDILELFEDLPVELRRRLALRAGGLPLLQEICYGDDSVFPDDLVVEQLTATNLLGESVAREHSRLHCLTTLFSRRPALTAVVLDRLLARVENDPSASSMFMLAASAAAQASNLPVNAVRSILAAGNEAKSWQYQSTLEALIKNPFVSEEMVDLIRTGPSKDAFAVKHALKYSHLRVSGSFAALTDPSEVAAAAKFLRANPWGTSLWSVIELLQNPLLEAPVAEELRMLARSRSRGLFQRLRRGELTAVGVDLPAPRVPREAPALSPPDAALAAELEEVTRLLGTDRGSWEAFVGLLNEFEGTLEELAELAAAV
jgi:hypothetical protein